MLKDQDIIYFSNDYDADNKTSSHHILEQLSKANRVLYIESSGLRSPKASAHDIGRILIKIKKFARGTRKISNNLYIFSPFLIPLHSNGLVRKLNRYMLTIQLKLACKNIGFKEPVLWVIIPHMISVIGALNKKMVVYYCVDDFSSLPGVEPSAVSLMDERMTKDADIVFTPSEPLYRKKVLLNRNTFLSPHGVDIEHFSKALDENLNIPEEIANIDKPIIGFFGLLESWIDLKLIKYIADKRPNWSIVMIGRVAQDIDILKDSKNVHLLGKRDYGTLPAYGRFFDVAILPYVLNKQVFSANPIKLREYLAMGKPVVSIRSPEMDKFKDVIMIADSYEQFVDMIEKSILENSKLNVEKRRDRIKNSSWENRFEFISEKTEDVLRKVNK